MILFLHPFAGISGDMLLGALIDLGAPVAGIEAAVRSTGLDGWRLTAVRAAKGGLMATRAQVRVDDDATARPAARLLEHVARAEPEPVARLAATAVRLLAEAEGALHGVDPGEVHLHEIGGLDTVVDTVGTAAALHLLGVEQVVSAPVVLGRGTVATAHGRLPAPAPATLALLRGAEVSWAAIAAETVTPTGAALLAAAGASYRPAPPMTVRATGYGAGSRELPDRPNVLQATLGEALGAGAAGSGAYTVLETNVDDTTGEVLGHLIGAALDAGAADAWITPAVMKKNRPAHTVHVLCRASDAPALETLVLAHTGSLGLRRTAVDRVAVERAGTTVHVSGHPVRIKYGPWQAKPEHDDVVRAAAALGVPPRTVAEEARRLAPSALGGDWPVARPGRTDRCPPAREDAT
ncbi:nickel pincer cofactor biosynthesis protein LarC [Allonocardiopsis opalescens]|uniref:Pyridinium-3,5-bisthiocarboxylic acid mononucleotide nickel insertion protein n=1 Tax=Allonocardiopsis opalescens TaxID=1144618 RepID=A0A2T0QEY8_9ACTN|nr:nickel pincer cofactor biosynthesis protein LarC [Allonocardiopsis opalescens]PRY02413.1 hypothetical protein CLV72_1011015 [Allonocardiopsis opalescens]